MEKLIISPNNRTREYMLILRDKMINVKNNMQSSNNIFSENDNLITLSMDNTQRIHSFTLSDILFQSSGNQEIRDRIKRLINNALLESGNNGVEKIINIINVNELESVTSDEKQIVRDNVKKLAENIHRSLKNISSINKTIVSKSGNIEIIISGTRIIQSLEINNEFLSSKNKPKIEAEIIDTINKAIQEIQNEMQAIIKKDEEELLGK